MKKMKLIAASLLMSLPTLLSAQAGKFTIEGRVGNYSSPAKAFLAYYGADGKPTQDSVVLQNGRFSFSGSVEYPKEAWVIINPDGGTSDMVSWDWRSFIMFYLEPGKLKINCTDSIIAHATVKGGPVNKDNEYLRKLSYNAQKKQNESYDDYYNAPKEKQRTRALQDTLSKRLDISFAERKKILKKFVMEHPNSFRSLYALQAYSGGSPNPADIEPMFKALAPFIRESKPGKEYLARIEKAKVVKVGVKAPEFKQTDTAGNTVALRDFRGKYVLIDFWASWCKPCRAENPNVVKAYQQYKDKNFTILGVALEKSTDRDKWLEAIRQDNLTWTQVSDLKYWQNEAAQLYVISSIPQNFLIDPSGKIIAHDLRGEALTEKLKELLDK